MNPVKVWYLFNRPRAERQRLILAGRWPEEGLYGFNRLSDLGYVTDFSDRGHQPSAFRWGLKRFEDILSDKGKKVGFNLAQAWTLRKKLNQADLIFATADSSALGALALKAAGVIHTPIVYASIGLVEGFATPGGTVHGLYRRLIHHADQVIYYGHEEGKQLKALFDLPEDRLSYVPFCVEAGFFSTESKRDGNPLAIGLDHRRDWPLLFEAASDVSFEIDLVCNPDMLQGLKIPSNVNLTVPLPMLDLRGKIAKARFVVLPVKQNAYTGATITLLQCMAAGCASIVSSTKAIEHGYPFRDGKNCLLVSPGDRGQLTEAMNLLNDQPILRKDIGAKARETVTTQHDIKHYIAKLDSIFRDVLNLGAVGD